MRPNLEDDWREVTPYLDEVLQLDEQGRRAWLAELDRRSPEAAARVRPYLLRLAELDEERFLDDLPALTLAVAGLEGQVFGAYALLRRLGHDRTSTVWLARRNDNPSEGQAAVKLLNIALASHSAEQHFVHAARVLSKLRHPNIASLLDAGIGSGSQPYLTLQLIRGNPIDLHCEMHNLGIERRIELFLDVLAAVAHAHSRLVLHRDLKPANILVSTDGVVKLLDVGVAALLAPSGESSDDSPLTPPAVTPGYAAPEQLLGEDVTTATDVYTLGVVLFVMLTGQHPLSPEGKTAAELTKLTLEGQIPRLAEVVPSAARRRLLSGDLENIVSTALRRNPAERYTTVESFAADLRRYLSLEPVLARPPSLPYLAAKFARRHRRGAIFALSAAAVLVGAVAVTTSKMIDARRQLDQARYQTRRAEAFSEFLRAMMQSDSGPNRPRLSYFERAELGVRMINQQYLAEDPPFAGRMLVQLAGTFRDNGETARATDIYKQVYELGRRNHDIELMALAQCSRASGEAAAGSLNGTLERVKEGERLLDRIAGVNSTVRADCLLAEGQLEQGYGHDASAESLLRRAIAEMEAGGDARSEAYATALSDLGAHYLARKQLREVLRIVQRVGEIDDRNGRGETAERLVVRQNAALVLAEMGEVSAALAEREVIQRRLYDVESPGHEPLAYQINYASVLLRMDRPADSMRALQTTLERARQAGNTLVLARTLLMRGSILLRLRRWDEAEAALGEALTVADGIGNRNFAAQAETLLAQLDLALGSVSSAHTHSERSLELGGYHTNQPERGLAAALLTAARVALAVHAFANAEQFAQDALAIGESVARGSETSADVGEALLLAAEVRIESGAPGPARPLLERAARCLSNGLEPNHPLALEARHLLTNLDGAGGSLRIGAPALNRVPGPDS